jgi:hypothetical protein
VKVPRAPIIRMWSTINRNVKGIVEIEPWHHPLEKIGHQKYENTIKSHESSFGFNALLSDI